MSIAIMTEVWKITGLSGSQKLVFLSLADNANDQGECYPSMRQVAARTCLSERAVRDAIRSLERLGYVSSASRAGTSSVYFLTTSPENLNHQPRQMMPPTPAGNAAPANGAPRQEMPPTPAAPAPPPRQMAPPTPAAPAPKPSLNRHMNRQGTVSNSRRRKKAEAPEVPSIGIADLTTLGVTEQAAAEFLALRRRKRAVLTPLALEGIRREAGRAGITLDDALRKCVVRGWQGFEAAWLQDARTRLRPPTREERAETEHQKFLEIVRREQEDQQVIDMEQSR